MDLQSYLITKFSTWQPPPPVIMGRSKSSIKLDWSELNPFHFLKHQLLFRLEKNNKYPPWIVVYRGGTTAKEIYNLAPRYPHKFRLKVIVKQTAVSTIAEEAINYYGDEQSVFEAMQSIKSIPNENEKKVQSVSDVGGDNSEVNDGIGKGERTCTDIVGDDGDKSESNKMRATVKEQKWLESCWSEPAWGSTDTDGSSIVCFCMAVRCGYLKQVQSMLEERPSLIGIVNPTNGFTPLATAVKKGDINTVRVLLNAEAEVDQRSGAGQTALHIAVLNGSEDIVDLLLERGADFKAQDVNGLRVEHYAVDSCDLRMLRHILDRGGDLTVTDFNGWTPLFRAVCQGARTEMIEVLVLRGSELNVVDHAGLPLTSLARLLVNRHGRPRESVLRLVDSSYPHEKALANFTRLTKKIYNVHSLFKLPVTNKQTVRK